MFSQSSWLKSRLTPPDCGPLSEFYIEPKPLPWSLPKVALLGLQEQLQQEVTRTVSIIFTFYIHFYFLNFPLWRPQKNSKPMRYKVTFS